MYYQPNQYQNNKNYAQNYPVPTTQNPPQTIKNNQYQYQGYTVQPATYTAQPQYQNVQNVQNIKAPHQILTHQNYQNIPQKQHYHQNVQNAQNVQYIPMPEQKKILNYPQKRVVAQPAQVVQKLPYNIQTNAIDGNQYMNVQIPTNNPNTVVYQNVNQNPGLVQNIQANTLVGQQPGQKVILNAPKNLAVGHHNKLKNPSYGPGSNRPQINNPEHQNDKNQIQQHHNNPNKQSFKQYPNNQTVNVNVNNTIVEGGNTEDQKLKNKPLKKPLKKVSLMTIKSLAGLEYKNYPDAEFSKVPTICISGYGANSYNGKIKSYNEDKIKVQYNLEKNYLIGDKPYKTYISYFGIFDGHGGDACSIFLKEKLDKYLFIQPAFPQDIISSVKEAFKTAETEFRKIAVKNGNLVDKSGSCALIALIKDDTLYGINLGDSRGLYSRDGGKEFHQLTRDHKPNDPKEQARIEKAGGKVYYANIIKVNGVDVKLKEENYGGFKFPYRLSPSGLAVSEIY